MAKRGRKPKNKVDWGGMSGTLKSVAALLLLLFGVILLISFFTGFGDGSPAVNSGLRYHMTNAFGLSTIFVPFILIYASILTIGTITWKYVRPKYFIAVVLGFICFLGMTGAGISGTVGGYIQSATANLISTPGAIFFYFVGLLMVIVVFSNKGLEHWLKHIIELIKAFAEKILRIKPNEDGDEAEPALVEVSNPIDANREQSSYHNMYGAAAVGGEFVSPGVSDAQFNDAPSHKKVVEVISPPSSPVGEGLEGELVGVGAALGGATLAVGALPFTNKVWEYPGTDLLSNAQSVPANAGDVNERSRMIEQTLSSFGIKARIEDHFIGPAVTQYAISIPQGAKANKITSLGTDLALRLKSPSGSVRIEAPIPGSDLIGIEVPNYSPATVSLRNVLESPMMKANKSKLSIAVGIDVSGKPVIEDISKWPHCLVAGATGSGKSVMLNAIITSLLFRCSPQECKFIMIDPKMVELIQYNDIPHLLAPVVTDVEQKAVSALAWAVAEMERRYKMFSNVRARNLEDYNAISGFQAEPYIVIVVDELAELMMVASSDVERYIARLAQKSRATGIHLILATQRPSVNVLTGTIKANIPTRIAFRVTSNVDSRVIIDQSGAETLIGRGDMLFVPPSGSKPKRIQGVHVTDAEINALTKYLKQQGIEPDYKPEILEQKVGSINMSGGSSSGGGDHDLGDSKMVEALEIVLMDGKASASHLQRKLKIGYSRAASLVDMMQAAGIVGQQNGSKPRDVLVGSVDEAVSRIKGADSQSGSDNSGSDF